MTKSMKWQAITAIMVTLAILVIDQIIKIEVKTNMTLHESIRIADWFHIFYIENNGMAWGMSIMPKIMLTLFRLVAIIFIGWYIYGQIKKGARMIYIVLLSMLLAGAAGNLIDCMFYGMIFSNASPYYVSYFVPFGEGYAPFLEGRVVDMFYFPLIVTEYPDWFPFWGGEKFIFFSPVFNFADASISVSVVALVLFCRKEIRNLSFFDSKSEDECSKSETEESKLETEESKSETEDSELETEVKKTETTEAE